MKVVIGKTGDQQMTQTKRGGGYYRLLEGKKISQQGRGTGGRTELKGRQTFLGLLWGGARRSPSKIKYNPRGTEKVICREKKTSKGDQEGTKNLSGNIVKRTKRLWSMWKKRDCLITRYEQKRQTVHYMGEIRG